MQWRNFDWWRRQIADRQTKRTANRQTGDRTSKMKRCLLIVKTGKLVDMTAISNSIVTLFRKRVEFDVVEKMMIKTTIQSWRCYETCWIDCQQNSWSWRFYETCQLNWKKNHEKTKINCLYNRDVFMKRVMQMKSDLKNLIDQYKFIFFSGRMTYIYCDIMSVRLCKLKVFRFF